MTNTDATRYLITQMKFPGSWTAYASKAVEVKRCAGIQQSGNLAKTIDQGDGLYLCIA
jgi:hypothetical protein